MVSLKIVLSDVNRNPASHSLHDSKISRAILMKVNKIQWHFCFPGRVIAVAFGSIPSLKKNPKQALLSISMVLLSVSRVSVRTVKYFAGIHSKFVGKNPAKMGEAPEPCTVGSFGDIAPAGLK